MGEPQTGWQSRKPAKCQLFRKMKTARCPWILNSITAPNVMGFLALTQYVRASESTALKPNTEIIWLTQRALIVVLCHIQYGLGDCIINCALIQMTTLFIHLYCSGILRITVETQFWTSFCAHGCAAVPQLILLCANLQFWSVNKWNIKPAKTKKNPLASLLWD